MTTQVYLTENDLVLSTENKLLVNRLNQQRLAIDYFKLSVDTYLRLAGFRDSSDTTALSLHDIESNLADSNKVPGNDVGIPSLISISQESSKATKACV